MTEATICPRREENRTAPIRPNGDDKVLPPSELDEWSTDRWKDWPASLGTAPRSCSYCGSIHPDDAIRLIQSGWEIEPTTKCYKWYINTPGSKLHHMRVMRDIANPPEAMHARVIPMVKFHGPHGSPAQLVALNKLYDKQKGRTT